MSHNKKPEIFYSVSQFAKAIGVHPQTIRRWDNEGLLKPQTRSIGGQRRYTQKQVEEYFATHQ